MRRSFGAWIPAILLPLLMPLTACDDSVNGTSDGTASLSVYLTDQPGDVDAVWVEILGITLHGGDGDPVQLLGAPTDLILLTDLVGTSQLLVDDAELDPKLYGQLRLQVGDAVLLSKEGTAYIKGDPAVLPDEVEGLPTGDLQCPSCSQSGLKVTIPNDELVLEEGETAMVLDFVVAESFGHVAGNSGKWVMHPVIHGTLTDTPTSAKAVLGKVELGVVEGTTDTPIEIPACPEGTPRSVLDFIPTATADALFDGEGNPIVRTGTVAEGGVFQIGFLANGSYTLGYVDQMTLGDFVLSFTASVEPPQVLVEDADVEGVLFTIQSAQCQPVG